MLFQPSMRIKIRLVCPYNNYTMVYLHHYRLLRKVAARLLTSRHLVMHVFYVPLYRNKLCIIYRIIRFLISFSRPLAELRAAGVTSGHLWKVRPINFERKEDPDRLRWRSTNFLLSFTRCATTSFNPASVIFLNRNYRMNIRVYLG